MLDRSAFDQLARTGPDIVGEAVVGATLVALGMALLRVSPRRQAPVAVGQREHAAAP